jgi:hypothetical protein
MARVSDRDQIIALVRLKLPPGMTPGQGTDELRRSIRFGQPDVTLIDVLEAPDEQDR